MPIAISVIILLVLITATVLLSCVQLAAGLPTVYLFKTLPADILVLAVVLVAHVPMRSCSEIEFPLIVWWASFSSPGRVPD